MGFDFCTYVRMIYLARTNEKMHYFLSVFYYHFSIPPRSGGLRNTRFVFRGPIWMRLKNSGNFCVGQVPRTSHVATMPKKHVSDVSVPRCHGLLQQAPPQFCLWLGIEGVLHVIRTRYQIFVPAPGPRCTFFSPFSSAGSSKQILEDCLLLLAAAVFLLPGILFFTFLSLPKCMRQGRMVVVLDQRSGAAYHILRICIK